MKITVYTVTDCQFSKQEKEYLTSKNLPFEEKNLETNKDFLTEMLAVSDNFAGTPVTRIEKDDGSSVVLKGFTQSEFDTALGFTSTAAQPAAEIAPQTTPAEPAVPVSVPPVSAPAMQTSADLSPAPPTPATEPETPPPPPIVEPTMQVSPTIEPPAVQTAPPVVEPVSEPAAPAASVVQTPAAVSEPALSAAPVIEPAPSAPVPVIEAAPSAPASPAVAPSEEDKKLSSILGNLQSMSGSTAPAQSTQAPGNQQPSNMPSIPDPKFV